MSNQSIPPDEERRTRDECLRLSIPLIIAEPSRMIGTLDSSFADMKASRIVSQADQIKKLRPSSKMPTGLNVCPAPSALLQKAPAANNKTIMVTNILETMSSSTDVAARHPAYKGSRSSGRGTRPAGDKGATARVTTRLRPAAFAS